MPTVRRRREQRSSVPASSSIFVVVWGSFQRIGIHCFLVLLPFWSRLAGVCLTQITHTQRVTIWHLLSCIVRDTPPARSRWRSSLTSAGRRARSWLWASTPPPEQRPPHQLHPLYTVRYTLHVVKLSDKFKLLYGFQCDSIYTLFLELHKIKYFLIKFLGAMDFKCKTLYTICLLQCYTIILRPRINILCLSFFKLFLKKYV